MDDITARILQIGRGAHLYKVDISRAFRHVRIDPSDYDKLGLYWEGVYFDSCLPFGFRHGSSIFQRISDAVRFIMREQGCPVINYADDVIGFGTPTATEVAFPKLCSLLKDLGFALNDKKVVSPTTIMTCLGVEINTKDFTISVPRDKLHKIYNLCQEWAGKEWCTKRQLQSLLGSLLHITKCVKNSRVFLNRMLNTLRNADNPHKI